MVFYPESAVERAMKIQEVILRAMAKRLTWCQAAEIIGISDRHLRRWYQRYQEFGYDGILHRANASICDPRISHTFKAFFIDEAWLFLKNPAIKSYIIEALKTWRKQNAAMILSTQSLDELRKSEILDIVRNSTLGLPAKESARKLICAFDLLGNLASRVKTRMSGASRGTKFPAYGRP
jgi:hypothetical protein